MAPVDLRKDDLGALVREYSYAHPGFFADAGLAEKVSTTLLQDHDDVHEKVRILPGDVLYIEDDEQRRFKLTVVEKPGVHRIALDIERVQ